MNPQRPLDAWKMVAGRRILEGRLPLSAFPRLAGLLFDGDGEVRFGLEFDRDALGIAYVELTLDTVLPLQCQRSLQRFGFAIAMRQRLGLIAQEADETGLPPGYEPLLVPGSGELCPADLIEDELILAVPVIPVDPDSVPGEQELPPSPEQEDTLRPNPFAALAALKRQS